MEALMWHVLLMDLANKRHFWSKDHEACTTRNTKCFFTRRGYHPTPQRSLFFKTDVADAGLLCSWECAQKFFSWCQVTDFWRMSPDSVTCRNFKVSRMTWSTVIWKRILHQTSKRYNKSCNYVHQFSFRMSNIHWENQANKFLDWSVALQPYWPRWPGENLHIHQTLNESMFLMMVLWTDRNVSFQNCLLGSNYKNEGYFCRPYYHVSSLLVKIGSLLSQPAPDRFLLFQLCATLVCSSTHYVKYNAKRKQEYFDHHIWKLQKTYFICIQQ